MKQLILSICALSLFTATFAQKIDRSIRPKPGPAPEIKLGEAESFTLENGLKVFVVENHKLPVVTYSIQLDIQPEPEGDKAGITSFVGELITSGTKNRSKDKFDEEVDAIAAYVGASSQGIFGRSLTKYQEKMLDLMSDALLNADFKQAELEKLRKQTLSGLDANRNDADAMMSRVSAVLNYGSNHPYGEVPNETTIKNVTLEDCMDYYKTYFRPNVAYLAIVGDIDLAKAKELANKYFGKWQRGPVMKAQLPAVKQPEATEVDFVVRDGAVQSVVSITHPIDLMIGTPDVIKTRVLNQILGGSFQRLDNNLRETHAWTYGSNSSIRSDEVVGQVSVDVKCRNEVTDSSITEMLKEMNLLRSTPVSQEELQGAINYLSGIFALGLENPQTIAQYAINIDRYKMPKDYYKNYLKNLSAITAKDVQEAANKYLATGNTHIIVVGNKSEIPKLKKFAANGELKFFDGYGNKVKPVETKVIDGMDAEKVLAKYIDAIGGKAAIEGLKDLLISGDMDGMGMKQGVTIATVSPEKMKQVFMIGNAVQQKLVINGTTGFMEGGGQKQELPADMVNSYKKDADLQVLLHPEKYGITYELLDKERVDNIEVYTLEKVSDDGDTRTTEYYSTATGLLVKEVETKGKGDGTRVSIKKYADYKVVKNGNGYKIPYTIELVGQGTITVTTAKANSGVKDSTFR
jgi:zinc protease